MQVKHFCFLLKGGHSLLLNGEDISSIEDIRKWTVNDVFNFIISLPGCSDCAQVIMNINHIYHTCLDL